MMHSSVGLGESRVGKLIGSFDIFFDDLFEGIVFLVFIEVTFFFWRFNGFVDSTLIWLADNNTRLDYTVYTV